MDTQDNWSEQIEPNSRNSTFAETASFREPFLTAQITQRLDLIRHLAANSDRIPLVKGVVGVGKSTLMDLLLRQAPADWEIYQFNAIPMLQQDQLISDLCSRFSVQRENCGGTGQLIQKFADLRQTGGRPVIIVDDAEQLTAPVLAELFGIFSRAFDHACGLALILFASPKIDDLLKETQLQSASQKLQVLQLSPLNREQSDQLASHLFEVLGGQGARSVSAQRFEAIFRTSGGLPGKIIQQVEKILQPQTKTPVVLAKRRIFLPQLLSDVSPPVLVGAFILTLLLLLTLIFEDEINAVFEPEGSSSAKTGTESDEYRRVLPLPLPEQPLVVERSGISQQIEATGRSNGSPMAASEPDRSIVEPTVSSQLESDGKAADTTSPLVVELPQVTAQQPINEPDVPQPFIEQPTEQRVTTFSEKINPAKSTPSLKPPIADPASVEEATKTSSAASKAASPQTPAATTKTQKGKINPAKNIPSVELPIANPTSVEEAAKTGSAASTAASPQTPTATTKTEKRNGLPAPVTELGQAIATDKRSAPEPTAPKQESGVPSPAPVQEGGVRREAWLLKQSPDSYTLQLIGVGNERAVNSFIRRHRLQENAAYYRTDSNGRPWFPVLYGLYPSRGAAVAARAKLPQELTQQGIWPRSLASIQQAIRGE